LLQFYPPAETGGNLSKPNINRIQRLNDKKERRHLAPAMNASGIQIVSTASDICRA